MGGDFTDMFFHCVAFNRKFPPTPTLRGYSVAVQETEQWVGLCLVPVRFRTYDEQLEALIQVPSPQAQPSLVSLHWFRGGHRVVLTTPLVQRQVPMVQAALETAEVQQFAVHRQGILRLLRLHKLSRENADHPEDPEDC